MLVATPHFSRESDMSKIDFTKELRQLYAPPTGDFAVVDVPPLHYLMLDGAGDPNTAPAYTAAVETLYAIAYRAKFISKGELGRDYIVPPLEGLWWAEDMRSFTSARDKRSWSWTMMILLPEWITPAIYARACEDVARKRAPANLPALRMEAYCEGLAAQIMHIGPYDDEGPTLARLHGEWLPQHGYAENGKHHEIYLSDPRRAAPSKMRTVLRQPIRAR
jgi:hypothetical protein